MSSSLGSVILAILSERREKKQTDLYFENRLPAVVPMWGLQDMNTNLGSYIQEQVRKLIRNEEASHTGL